MPDDIATRPAAPAMLRAAFTPDTWNAESRTVDVVWTTGAPVQRRDWMTGQIYTEALAVTAEAIDLERLNSGAPVLDTHSSYALGDVVGVVERASVADGEGRATLRFSDRPEVAGIVADVASGILRNISVGYRVESWDITPATRDAPELRTAVRWTPYELSLVPVPADPRAQVRAGPSAAEAARDILQSLSTAARAANQEPPMSDPVITPAAASAAVDHTAAVEAARAAERARVSELRVIARQASLDDVWLDARIDSGAAPDAARAEALAAVASRATARVPAEVAGARQDEGDTARRHLQNALEHMVMQRSSVPLKVELEEGARRYRGFQLIDYARACIELGGGTYAGLTKIETFQRAFAMGREKRFTRAGTHTSGDFPDLLANTASKSLRAAYEYAPRTFLSWTNRMDLPDFKDFKLVALGGAPALDLIGENGEVTYGTIDDAAETCTLLRYGKALAVSYVALVNDDMSGFTRIPAMFGQAAADKESAVVYAVLTANANMSDGNALIGAAHANTTTGALTADATGVTNVGKVQNLLRQQTGPEGRILNLTMRTLLVPSGKEVVAAQLFASANVVSTLGAVNPFRSTVQVVAEPRLDATSAVAYYGVADPMQIDTIVYGYLQGEAGPTLTSDIEFDTDGLKVKATHNFYAKAADWRGIAYSTGA